MRIAVTGGTGFVGGHLAKALSESGHDVVVIARGVDDRPWAREVLALPGVTLTQVGIDDEQGLVVAFDGCDAVAHCAGINREVGSQTYEAVHVRGTARVVCAAEAAGVRRLAYVSFLRARPDCGSPYHESKWKAEEIVRRSTCDWTVLKPGMMYGRGDHMLDHLSHAIHTFPAFLGLGERRVRPLAVDDLVRVLTSALVQGRLSHETVGVVGPTELCFDDAARLVSTVVGKKRLFLRAPIALHYTLARIAEWSMTVPLVSLAQVRILDEEVVQPSNAPDQLPADLTPKRAFDAKAVRDGLPEPGPFRLRDLRWFSGRTTPSSAAAEHGAGLLIFDGDCGFCTSAADWAAGGFRHGERIEPWQRIAEDELAKLGLSVRQVQEAAWWVAGAGHPERGHRAVGRALQAGDGWRAIAGRVVLVPPTSWLAAAVYALTVRWRYRLPGGTPACRVDGHSDDRGGGGLG